MALGSAPPQTAISLSLVQLAVIALMCVVAALWLTPGSGSGIQLPATGHDWLVVLYLDRRKRAHHGACKPGRRRISSRASAVIMAMEPVWAAAFAVAFGGESVTVRMVIGGLAIVSAMYLVEQPERRLLKSREHVA